MIFTRQIFRKLRNRIKNIQIQLNYCYFLPSVIKQQFFLSPKSNVTKSPAVRGAASINIFNKFERQKRLLPIPTWSGGNAIRRGGVSHRTCR
jgi:hypothetical protein